MTHTQQFYPYSQGWNYSRAWQDCKEWAEDLQEVAGGYLALSVLNKTDDEVIKKIKEGKKYEKN